MRIKKAVQFDLPQLKALKGRRNVLVDVPTHVVYRIFFYSLKSLLEATKYNILTKEDLLMSYVLTQLPSGEMVPLKDLLEKHPLLLLSGGEPNE